jgi:hypothetical protein
MAKDKIRIGGGQGFYGDGHAPLDTLLADGIDYLVNEALAELTLAILQKDRQRDEATGYAKDLPLYLAQAAPYVADGRTRFITNAGGINPIAAGRAVRDAAQAAGLGHLKIATVVGDDVRPLADQLDLPDDALFANAYLGARPIVEALDAGAHVVITGRVADASLFLAPLVHEFGWAWDDWDRLAAGVTAGHLLECSGQVAGGNYSGKWWENADPLAIGFPIGECEPDGTFTITKPAGTGGMVTFDTVREQLLYEVQDPRAYLNPDVSVDLTAPTLTDLGGDRVRVTGAKGAPPPETYKALVCRPAGWSAEVRLAYGWPDAEAKARAALAWVRARADQLELPIDEWHEEFFGVNAFHGDAVDLAAMDATGWEPGEVIGRLAWRADDPQTVGRLVREPGVLALSGPPMIGTPGRARDGKPTQLLAVDAIAVERALVDAQVRVDVS